MRRSQFLALGALITLVLITLRFVPATAQTATWPATMAATHAAAPLMLVWQTDTTPEALLATPSDIAVDSKGNVYVTMQGDKHVKK